MGDSKNRGEISLPGIFLNEANRLVSAVEQGRILHKTKNIRDSGAPLEAAVQTFFGKFLPQAYVAKNGYLYDPDSNCSQQLDVIISRTQKNSVALSSPDGATYSPFTEAIAIGEVKTSSTGIDKHLRQLGERVALIDDMRQAIFEATMVRPPRACSFLIIAESNDKDIDKIATYWDESQRTFPDFILFVESGQVVLPPSEYAIIFEHDDLVDPQSGAISDNPALYVSMTGKDSHRGNALLWFFYAVLHQLNKREEHSLSAAFRAFSSPDESYRDAAKIAAEVLSGVSDPFSKAMLHGKIQLRRQRDLKSE